MTVVATFPKLAHDWLKHELDRHIGRKAGKIKSGSGVVKTGTVAGAISVGTPTVAAKAGGNAANTGLLTLDVTTPALANAKVGKYTARCIAAASNSGTFRVEDPDGVVIGDVVVGATFADGVKFVIADGSQDFIVGEGFDITVPAGSGKYAPVSSAALDGSQNASVIVINGVDATSGDVETALLSRDAVIVPSELIWPEGATSDQKNAWLAQLERKGIVSHQR